MDTKILQPGTLLFKVSIPKTEEIRTLQDYIQNSVLPGQINQIFLRELKDCFEAICMSDNHSDYISLEERTGFKVTDI